SPLRVTSATLNESVEGQLVSFRGTLARIETGSNGSLALMLQDPGGEVRVFFHAPIGASRDAYHLGATVVAVGIAGQRESAAGMNDGYRIWPRDRSDVSEVAPPPTPTPSASPTPRPTPTATPRPSSSPS